MDLYEMTIVQLVKLKIALEYQGGGEWADTTGICFDTEDMNLMNSILASEFVEKYNEH